MCISRETVFVTSTLELVTKTPVHLRDIFYYGRNPLGFQECLKQSTLSQLHLSRAQNLSCTRTEHSLSRVMRVTPPSLDEEVFVADDTCYPQRNPLITRCQSRLCSARRLLHTCIACNPLQESCNTGANGAMYVSPSFRRTKYRSWVPVPLSAFP